MSSYLNVTKYQLYDFRRSVAIYYGVIVLLGAMLFAGAQVNDSTGQSSFSGASIIFIFVLGLNCFTSSFRFMQNNNVSRKRFYLGNSVAILSVAAIMALINLVFDAVYASMLPYVGFHQQIYSQTGPVPLFLWWFTLLALATSVGWLISMIYYRSTTMVKTLVSISPAVILIGFIYYNRVTQGRLVQTMMDFLARALGLTTGQTSYAAVLSFTIATIISLALVYLFVYRAPVKD